MNWSRVKSPAFVVAVAVLALGAGGMKAAIDSYRVYLRKLPIYPEQGRVVRAIPTETAGWVRVGQDREEPPEMLEVLGTENYLTRRYREKAARPGKMVRSVDLHAAYYTGMIDTVPHVPDRCLVASGLSKVGGPWLLPLALNTGSWLASEDAGAGVFTTRLSNDWSTAGRGKRVNLPAGLSPTQPLQMQVSEFGGGARASRQGGGQRVFAGYFFVANGGWVSSAEGVRFLAFNLTDDYAYYLKVQVSSTDVSSPEELAEVAGGLLDELLGELMTCVPDWPKVGRGEWPPDNPKKDQTLGR